MKDALLLSRITPLRPPYATDAEERVAARALLPPLERLLAGTGATLGVLNDGPNRLFGALGKAGLEAPGLFVCLRCPKAAWPEVHRRLEGAGIKVDFDDVDEEDDGQVKTWLGDVRRECCPFGCGRVFKSVERHAARCRLRPAEVRRGDEPAGRGRATNEAQ